jgi:alpha-glucosidase
VLFSGIQHFGLTPEQVAAQPEHVREYLRELPTTWDETRFVDGYPGQLAVLARRKGKRWYVAAINGRDSDQTLKLDLAFAGDGNWTMIADGEEGGTREETVKLAENGVVELNLRPNGGAVLLRDDE